jgi:hypothetical protein
MDRIEQARELFAKLEGQSFNVSEVALRTFEVQDRLARIRS